MRGNEIHLLCPTVYIKLHMYNIIRILVKLMNCHTYLLLSAVTRAKNRVAIKLKRTML